MDGAVGAVADLLLDVIPVDLVVRVAGGVIFKDLGAGVEGFLAGTGQRRGGDGPSVGRTLTSRWAEGVLRWCLMGLL